MTLHVTIKNEQEGNAGHKINVNVFEEHMGGRDELIEAECCELAPGESRTITLWGTRGVTVVEQRSG